MRSRCLLGWAVGALASPVANSSSSSAPATRTPPMTTTVAPSSPAPASASNCTYTLTHIGALSGGSNSGGFFTNGPVATVWAATRTATERVNCSGCTHLAVETRPGSGGGHGPVVSFTTTTTIDAATPRIVTARSCMLSTASPSSAMATDSPPTTMSPSPPPALPTSSQGRRALRANGDDAE